MPKKYGSGSPPKFAWTVGVIPALCSVAPSFLVAITGAHIFWWSGPMLVVAGALLESTRRRDRRNPSPDEILHLTEDPFYKWCTYAFIPINFLGLLIACEMWTDAALDGRDLIGLTLTMGLMSGFAINVAHELGHQKNPVERRLSKIATASVWYAHFHTEHSRGHHVHVATPVDAVSARFGESFYRFLGRSLIGEFRFAIEAERARLRRRRLPFFSRENDIIHGWLLSAALYSALTLYFGWGVLPHLICHTVIALAFLESVNYIEHYGLLRERRPDGRYERSGPQHSWNSTLPVTGLATFHLQRHSDHHTHPGRRYQLLRIDEHAPELPGGYGQMVLLALVPRLWSRVMNPRVLALYGGDITRANLTPELRRLHGQPGHRRVLLARTARRTGLRSRRLTSGACTARTTRPLSADEMVHSLLGSSLS
ncbi:alkane 1-monooxygenase [Tsukamurella strandjordii]|uniref:alkane 1-monooxygenase n=1 Tax=Tsukamurella strandjordii TaxID=147577 RepID=UPI0031D140FD